MPITQSNHSVNYGDGIKIVRLWQDRIMEIEDVKSEDEEQENEDMA